MELKFLSFQNVCFLSRFDTLNKIIFAVTSIAIGCSVAHEKSLFEFFHQILQGLST